MKPIHQLIDAHLAQFYWEWGNEPIGFVTIGKYNHDDELKVMGFIPREWLKFPGLSHVFFNCPFS